MTQQTNATERDALLLKAAGHLDAFLTRLEPDDDEVVYNSIEDTASALRKMVGTANASEASVHTAAVSSGEGVEHKKAIWVVCCPYVGGVKIYGAFDNAHDAEKLRSSKETGKRAEVHTSWLTYAPPPSDSSQPAAAHELAPLATNRAAVEGVSDGRVFDISYGHVRAVACPKCLHTKCGPDCLCECTTERARASDPAPNAAAAPVGQAVAWRSRANADQPWRITQDESALVVLRRVGHEIEPLYTAPPTPRATYRQPTIEDAREAYRTFWHGNQSGTGSDSMLAALNSIGAVIAEEVPK